MVSIQISRSTAELSRDRRLPQCTELLFQPIHIDHHLLAKACGRCRLAMGLSQHRHVFPLLGIVVELLYKFFHERAVDLFDGLLHRKGNAGIVDILRGESEMNELLVVVESLKVFVELLLDIILHGLHVVVRHFLYIFHTLCLLWRDIAIDVAQPFKKAVVETL